MAVSSGKLVEHFPELKGFGPEKLQAALARAHDATSESVFGADYEQAVMLLATHELMNERTAHTSVPFNPDPKAKASGGSAGATTRQSTYLQQRKALARRRVIPLVCV